MTVFNPSSSFTPTDVTQVFDLSGIVAVDGTPRSLIGIDGITSVLNWDDLGDGTGVSILGGSMREIGSLYGIPNLSGYDLINAYGGINFQGNSVINSSDIQIRGATNGSTDLTVPTTGSNITIVFPGAIPSATQVLTVSSITGIGANIVNTTWTTPTAAPVSSVFGRTGVVVATSGDYTTAQVTESGNLYFTNARARTAIAGGIEVTFQGNGSTISVGTKAYSVYFPYSGTITSATLLSDASGSIAIDIWKVAYATVPTIANTIVASAPPTLSSAQVSRDTTLTGWSKTVTAGDNWIFNVNSATTVQMVTLTLEITRT